MASTTCVHSRTRRSRTFPPARGGRRAAPASEHGTPTARPGRGSRAGSRGGPALVPTQQAELGGCENTAATRLVRHQGACAWSVALSVRSYVARRRGRLHADRYKSEVLEPFVLTTCVLASRRASARLPGLRPSWTSSAGTRAPAVRRARRRVGSAAAHPGRPPAAGCAGGGAAGPDSRPTGCRCGSRVWRRRERTGGWSAPAVRLCRRARGCTAAPLLRRRRPGSAQRRGAAAPRRCASVAGGVASARALDGDGRGFPAIEKACTISAATPR